MVYTSPITVATSQTIKAVALAPGKTVSNELVAAYVIGLPVDLFIDFETGTAGDLITTGALAASEHGASLGSWFITYESTGVNHCLIDANNFSRRTPVVCNGSTFSGAGTRGLKFDMAGRSGSAGYQTLNLGSLPISTASVCLTALMEFGLVGSASTDTSVDHFVMNAAGFVVMQQTIPAATFPNGFLRAHGGLAGGGSSFGANIPITSGGLYYVALLMDTVNNLARVMILDGSTYQFVGYSEGAASFSGGFATLEIQDYLQSFGGSTLMDSIALDWTNAKFPGESFTINSPITSAVQSGPNEITISWTALPGLTYLLERNSGSGWSTLSSSATSPYVDGSLAGHPYQYRLTGSFGAVSGVSTSGTITLTVDTPVITPPSSSYSAPLTVTITCDTVGSSIYYTLDGSTPTNASTLYSAPFVLTATTATVKSIAYVSGMTTSGVSSQTYTYAAITYLINQDFEGVGTPSGWFSGGAGSVNFNSIISPLAGLQSLRIDATAGTGAAGVNVAGSELFGKFLFRPATITASFTRMYDIADVSNLVATLYILSNGTIEIHDPSGLADVTTAGSLTAGTTYRIYWHYKKGTGANGIVEVGFATTDVRPSSGPNFAAYTTGTATTDVSEMQCVLDNTLADYDNVQIASTSFN